MSSGGDEVWSWDCGSVVGNGLGSVQEGIHVLPRESSGMIWSGLLHCEGAWEGCLERVGQQRSVLSGAPFWKWGCVGNAVSIQCEHSFSVFLQKLAGRVA